jgi:hypothetical protein
VQPAEQVGRLADRRALLALLDALPEGDDQAADDDGLSDIGRYSGGGEVDRFQPARHCHGPFHLRQDTGVTGDTDDDR